MIAVHIGLKKAGSTSIQSFLSANEKKLHELSIDYPEVGRGHSRAHNNFVYEIMGSRKFAAARGTLEDLARYWQNAQSRTMALSSEMFEGANPRQITKLKTDLCKCGKGEIFIIIVVIRDLLDVICSSYAQRIKYGYEVYEFDEFFTLRIKEVRNHYFETVKRWADVFGWECMRIRLLDRRYLRNGDLFEDFLAVLGVEMTSESFMDLQRPGIKNAAPGWRVLEAVRALFSGHHGLPEGHPLLDVVRQDARSRTIGSFARKVGEGRGWNNETGRYLTRAQAQHCLQIYRQAIESLNQALADKFPLPPDLEARGFREREFKPDATQIPREQLLSFYEELFSLYRQKGASGAATR